MQWKTLHWSNACTGAYTEGRFGGFKPPTENLKKIQVFSVTNCSLKNSSILCYFQ